MRVADSIAGPTVEGIVKREARVELHKIIFMHPRQAERRGKQTSGLRCEIETCGIGGPHDESKTIERFAMQAKLLDHHIEGAKLAAVTPKNVIDVERRRMKSVCDIRDFGG